MGHNGPAPHRWPVERWRATAPTVSIMAELGWKVFSVCGTCGLRTIVPLDALARLNGPTFSLWNRDAPCLSVECKGRRTFECRPPRAAKTIRLICEVEPSPNKP